jgi:putative ABC transport system permease protein
METIFQDLRFALRNLRRTPTFPLAAICTLALGIGATTAIFSTVNAALLRPLPYPSSQDLYSLHTAMTDGRVTSGLLSPVEMLRLAGPTLPIDRVAGLIQQDVTLLRDDGTPLRTHVFGVTEGFFELFGLPLSLGPGFNHGQFVGNAPPVVVISYRVWQDMFGGDRAVVGKPIRFSEITTTIVGVAAADFDTPHGAGFWFNLSLDPQGVNHNFEAYMRLHGGTNLERAKGQMTAVMASLAHDFPMSDSSRVYVVRPLVESIVGDLGPILIVVLSATGLLLVLSCVNVANLLLARGSARAREIAVRVSLGAGRGRIVRQLLTESILLAGGGGIVGVAAAYGGVRVLLAIGASKLPRLDAVPFDSRVLLFALGTLFVSGVLVGFAPALRLAATDVKTLMNEASRSSSVGRTTARWLSAMTVAQVALAVALVAGAGWLVRAFANLSTIDPGFATEGRLVFDVTFQGARYRTSDPSDSKLVSISRDLLNRIRNQAGVIAIGSTSDFPLNGSQDNSIFVQPQGDAPDPAHPMGTRQRSVSPGLFDALGIKLVSGRDFTDDDHGGTTPVVIVNRTFARRFLAGRDPLRVRFAAGYPTIDLKTMFSIVGVVDDVRQHSLTDAPEPAYYTPEYQGFPRRQTFVVHTSLADTVPLQKAIRQEVSRLDPQIAIDFQAATDLVGATLVRQQLGMTLMVLFGLAALALAAVGIYGVIAYATAERRNEVATRLALGATQANVFWLIMRQGRLLTASGALIGVAVAYFSGRVVTSRLYEVRAADPLILGAAALVVAGFAIMATTIPAYRASRLDPVRVLRPD